MNRYLFLTTLSFLLAVPVAMAQRVNPFGPPSASAAQAQPARPGSFPRENPNQGPSVRPAITEPTLSLEMHFVGKINGMYIYKSGNNFVYRKTPLYKISATAPLALSSNTPSSFKGAVPRLPPPTPARNLK